MKQKPKFQLAVLTALVFLASCSTPWQKNALPHKEPYKSDEADVTLTFQRLEGDDNGLAVIRFANHSNHDVFWDGYDYGGGPIYFLVKRGLSKWRPLSQGGWCGTGLGDQHLAAGQSLEFTAGLFDYGKGQFQVGVGYHFPSRNKTLFTWSPPFRRQ